MKLFLTLASVSTLLSSYVAPAPLPQWESALAASADFSDAQDKDKVKGKGNKQKDVERDDDDDDDGDKRKGEKLGADTKGLEKKLEKHYRELAELERKTEHKRMEIARIEEQLFERGVTPASMSADDAWYRDFTDDEGLVTICHRSPGKPGAARALRVSPAALNAHLRHGDSLGDCSAPGRPTRADGKGGKRSGGELPEVDRRVPRERPDTDPGSKTDDGLRPRKKGTTPAPTPKGGKGGKGEKGEKGEKDS